MKRRLTILVTALVLLFAASITAAAAPSESKGSAGTVKLDTTVNGNFAKPGTHWYKFTSNAKNSYYEFTVNNTSGGNGEINLEVFEESKTVIKTGSILFKNDEKFSFKARNTNTKTYYVKVTFSAYVPEYFPDGSYSFKIRKVDDEAGDSKGTAKQISLNKEYNGKISVPYDEDFYKIKVGKTGKYVFKTKNIDMTSGDWSGHFLLGNYDASHILKLNKTASTTVTLKAGKTYYLKISNFTKDTGKYKFAIVNKNSITSKPTKVTAKASGKKTVKVSWKKVTGASKYYVYRSASKTKGFKKVATVSGKKTSYTNKKLTGGKKYYYKVKAAKSVFGVSGTSDYSAVKSATPKK